jgi:hypothetical protein
MNNKNYFFGGGSYDSALDIFSTTKVNSEKTSSLPLADFWTPRNAELAKFIRDLKSEIGDNFDYENAQKFFEYPTLPRDEKDKTTPYQFLHRAASACYFTENNKKKPILIYQLFYDETDRDKLKDFKLKLESWSKLLNNKIKFLIIYVPVKNAKQISETYKGIKSELFLRMKEKAVYEFDWNKIEIKNIDLLNQ